jgi:hypothetical protein
MQVISSTQVEVLENNWKACPEVDLLNLFKNKEGTRFIGVKYGTVEHEFVGAKKLHIHMGVENNRFVPILEIIRSNTCTYYQPSGEEYPLTLQISCKEKIDCDAMKGLVQEWTDYTGTAEAAFCSTEPNERVRFYYLEDASPEQIENFFATNSGDNFMIYFGICPGSVGNRPRFTTVLIAANGLLDAKSWGYHDYVGACPPNCE